MNADFFSQHKSWLVSAGIVVAITLWMVTGSGDDNAAGGATETTELRSAPQFAVRTRSQVAEEVVRVITVNGSTAPARTVEINAETDGRVVETGVDRGERVNEGGIIVRLDERGRQARLAEAQATVVQREAEYEARQRLESESYVSDAQVKEGLALLEAARAALVRSQLDLDYMYVRAPFDGALQERLVEVGDFVKSGDPIATFVDDRAIIVTASVSEFDAKYVTRGEEARARLATGEEVEGIVRYVAPVADEATRTFTVELEIDNSDGALRAGMSAELMLPAETIFAHRISPSLLTLDDEGNVGVKILNDEGIVEFYPADISLTTPNGVYIEGLPTTAIIITVGQGFVNEGSFVEGIPEDSVNRAVAIKSGDEANL